MNTINFPLIYFKDIPLKLQNKDPKLKSIVVLKTEEEKEQEEPMTILQLKKKHNLSFPFKVKRVRCSADPEKELDFTVGQFYTITQITWKFGLKCGFFRSTNISFRYLVWMNATAYNDYIYIK